MSSDDPKAPRVNPRVLAQASKLRRIVAAVVDLDDRMRADPNDKTIKIHWERIVEHARDTLKRCE